MLILVTGATGKVGRNLIAPMLGDRRFSKARTRGVDSIDIPSRFHSNRMDNSKARRLLDWRPDYDLEMLIDQAWTCERPQNDPRVVWYPG